MDKRFTSKAEKALNRSVLFAEELGHTYIGTEHILYALLEDEESCASRILKKNGIDQNGYLALIKKYSGTGTRTGLSSKDLTPRCRRILESSYDLSSRHNNSIIGTEHILFSLIDERDCIAVKLLKQQGADINSVKEQIFAIIKANENSLLAVKKDVRGPFLKQYGKNMTIIAKEGNYDPVIGRDKETERLIRVLSRKNKNNPCLIGEAGVGKTAIVEGLATRIACGNVPETLINRQIISVDLTSMVAGAKYRGDFEERIKNIIAEAAKDKSIILFIDEIHTIVGAGAAEGAIDAANILKPQLSRGEIQIIGATTFKEYHKYIEKDAALERRFQPIYVSEPNRDQSIEMLLGVKERYEFFHKVKITDEAIRCAVDLSLRYIHDRYLPDKALDVMDEACAYLLSRKDYKSLNTAYNMKQNINEDPPVLDSNCVSAVVSELSGVPVESFFKPFDYNTIESKLKNEVTGQEEAITSLVNSVRRTNLGINESVRPKGIFLFIGSSGVGKTHLAINLGKALFGDERAIVRLDMSEYSEKHSVSKLIGSPPGYQGHDDGGILTETIRRRPYALILLDEIEKAHTEVLNLFLQIADYGFLTDSSGRRIDFSNTYIVMTSNYGFNVGEDKKSAGFLNEDIKNDTEDFLKCRFKLEFINRIDEIIRFKDLTIENLEQIAAKRLDYLCNSLINRDIHITYDNDVPFIIAKNSYKKGLGARPVFRYIKNNVEIPLSEIIAINSPNILNIVSDSASLKIVEAETSIV